MPRGLRKVTTAETIDQEIEKAQQKVIWRKASYDSSPKIPARMKNNKKTVSFVRVDGF